MLSDVKNNEKPPEKEEEIQVEIEEEQPSQVEELEELLEKEKEKRSSCEDKLKRTLADYQNLEKKTRSDIVSGVNAKIDQFMGKFLSIYDDIIRAKTILAGENVNVEGLNGIIKNINSLLSEYNIKPIEALGEIFDPNLHEAISVIEEPELDDGTVTKEIRKGYICQNRVIRPSIVEISKKSENKKSVGE